MNRKIPKLVGRHEGHEQRHEGALHHCFGHREGVGRLGSWRVRLMMRQVKPAEQVPVVHQSMRLVKIGIMRHENWQGVSAYSTMFLVTAIYRVILELFETRSGTI
jgi:hypothetical protein